MSPRAHQQISEVLKIDTVYQSSKVILDAGCSSGAHRIRLGNEGYTAAGISISLRMVISSQRSFKEEKVAHATGPSIFVCRNLSRANNRNLRTDGTK